MKFRFLSLCAALLALAAGSANAQISKSDQSIEFEPGFYLQFLDGGVYSIDKGPFSKLLSPSFLLGGGYQFTPCFSLRANAGYYQSRNFSADSKNYSAEIYQLQGDAMLNLSNLIGGYRHDRFLNIWPFIGGGVHMGVENLGKQHYADAWEPVSFFPGFRTGINIEFRISNQVSASIEGNCNFIKDKFNSRIDNRLDSQLGMLAGLKLKLGKGHKTSSAYLAAQAAAAEAALAAERAAAERAAAEKAAAEKAEQDRLAAEQAAAEKAAAEAAERELREKMSREHSWEIFFQLDKHIITEEENIKVRALAEWLVFNPDYTAALCGYADRNTGNPSHNMTLSERRVNEVAKALVELGVPAGRITTDFKGDLVQPFATPEENRVVICIIK